jgi:hypothetical protein
MMSWSAIALSQVGLQGKTGFYVTRSLLGLLEGYVVELYCPQVTDSSLASYSGFIADTILYLS